MLTYYIELDLNPVMFTNFLKCKTTYCIHFQHTGEVQHTHTQKKKKQPFKEY